MNNEYLKTRLENLGYEVFKAFKQWFIFKGTIKIAEGTNLTELYNIIIKRTIK